MASALENFTHQLILASTSQRRRELLAYLGVPFTVTSPKTEEKKRPDEDAIQYALRNAREKAEAVYLPQKGQGFVAIGADTIGVLGDEVLEKPLDPQDAVRMLHSMSGHTHLVITAVAVVGDDADRRQTLSETFSVTTEVTFKDLTPGEIDYYVTTKEPLDKAGAYGIQGIGGFLVRSIKGSYSNVVGLPLVELSEVLAKWPRMKT